MREQLREQLAIERTTKRTALMRRLLITFFLLAVSIVWAAENQAPENASPNAQDSAVLDTELTPEELEAAENDELVLGETEADEQDAEENRGSSRFIPSEQISQDLGVSFPVDI